jgi:hypothetical protein
MSRSVRSKAVAATSLATGACLALSCPGIAAIALGGRGLDTANTARTLSAYDTVHLHLVRSSGAEIVEEGSAHGTLVGSVRGRFNVGPTVTAVFTIHLRGGGSISGRGEGTLHNGHGGYESFGGTLSITGGTGRYSHARGRGGFYGTLNRATEAMVVQTTGKLSY